MKISRRNFLKAAAVGGVFSSSAISFLIGGCHSDMMAGRGERPNILWLIGEDIGLDLSCYGAPVVKTPNLDRLAKEGVRFDNAFCASPICSPSRSSFNTGVYPASIGAHDHRTAKEKQKKLPEDVKTITQWFAEAGYHSCLMGNPKEDFNFIANGKTFQSRDWSNRGQGQPFFCVHNFVEPHRWGWGKWGKLSKHIDPDTVVLPPVYPDAPIMRQSFAKYLDFVVELDRKIGLVVRRLEDEGLLDNTIIFFFGDNGRTMYRGKQWLYDEGLRVPLIARYPSLFRAGSVRKDIVNLIDLAPTSLDLAGVSIPGSMQGQIIAGRNARRRRYTFASRDLCDTTRDLMRCVRDDRYKYIRNYMPETGYAVANYTKMVHPEWSEAKKLYEQGKLNEVQSLMFAKRKAKEELYDIKKDPWETDNLAGRDEYRKVLNRLRNELDKWIEEVRDQVLTDANS